MTETALLRLPYIASNQNQKHIIHNEALRMAMKRMASF